MSYTNILLYSSSLPTYKKPDKGKNAKSKADDTVINADDPKNKHLVSALLNQ